MKLSKSKSKHGLEENKSYEGLCRCAKVEKVKAPAVLGTPPEVDTDVDKKKKKVVILHLHIES